MVKVHEAPNWLCPRPERGERGAALAASQLRHDRWMPATASNDDKPHGLIVGCVGRVRWRDD